MKQSNSYEKQKSRRKNLIIYQIIVILGYAITQFATYLAKEFGFTSISYKQIVLIAATSIGLSLLVMIICLSLKNLSNYLLSIVEVIQFSIWLIIYIVWIYFLNEARIIGLFFSIMPLIFVIITSNPIRSVIIAILFIIIQISVSYYGIYFQGQSGSMKEVIFYTSWFAPSAFYIAYAAKVFHRKRTQLKIAKKEAEKALGALWGEMQIAKKIQRILLPKNPNISGYEIAHYMNPVDEVGGDYYDIIDNDEINWVSIGDVSGHGVLAGLIMMMVQSSIRSIVTEMPNIKPSDLLRMVNGSIKYNIKNMNEEKFMTITALAIKKDGSITFSGRHEDIIYYNKNSDEIKRINTCGIILSSWDMGHKEENSQLKMLPGDLLFLYTDGLIEAWHKDSTIDEKYNNMFGMERLERILQDNSQESPGFIKEKLISELKNFDVDDDITFIVIKKS